MWLYATMYIYIYIHIHLTIYICMYTTRLKMRMPQSLRFFRPRWMQLSSARLCHTLHNCNTKRPSWFFGCFGCLCKRPWENDVSHSLCCTREQRMQRIPDYKTQREKTAFCEVKVLLKQDQASMLPIPNSLLKLQRTCPCTWQQQRPPPLPWLRKLGLLFDRNTSFIILHAIPIFSILFYIFLLSRFLFSWIFTFHNEGNSTKTSGLQKHAAYPCDDVCQRSSLLCCCAENWDKLQYKNRAMKVIRARSQQVPPRPCVSLGNESLCLARETLFGTHTKSI